MDEYLYKVLVVGESGCGKTSLIRREVHNVFQMNCKTTIGVDFALKVLKTGDVNVTLQIWDIAGQEQFGHLTRVYYQAAVGALVVFDVSRGATFEKAVEWKKDIDNKVFLPDGSPLPCLLVANKCDLPWAKQPSNDEMNAFCAKHKFIGWIETSPKENINVDKCFRHLVEKVVENDQNIDQNAQLDMSSVRLDPRHNRPEDKPKSRCKC